MISSNIDKIQDRIRLLEEYMRSQVLVGSSFICRTFQQCRASRSEFPFYEGQLSHIGNYFDLEVDGHPTRIVLVGQEYGHAPAKVDLKARSIKIGDSAQAGFQGRNPHMKGTTSLLRLLLGREPGIDANGERLMDGHIFDGFALVNYLLCTALKEPRNEDAHGGGKGHSSSTMNRNCGRHFLRTLEILDPTVIVVQGKGVRQWLASTLFLPRRGPTAEIVDIAGKPVDLLTFNHPSAGGSAGWRGNSPQSRYLRETVAPVIKTFLAS